jgi:hypothetical protein
MATNPARPAQPMGKIASKIYRMVKKSEKAVDVWTLRKFKPMTSLNYFDLA